MRAALPFSPYDARPSPLRDRDLKCRLAMFLLLFLVTLSFMILDHYSDGVRFIGGMPLFLSSGFYTFFLFGWEHDDDDEAPVFL